MVSYKQLGTDIKSDWSFSNGDINLVVGKQNLGQAIVNRLRSDLDSFIFYDRYGGNLDEHLGDFNHPRIHEYIKIEIESICKQDPRVKQVEAIVNKKDSETATVALKLGVIGADEIVRLNLILNNNSSIFIDEDSSELSDRSI